MPNYLTVTQVNILNLQSPSLQAAGLQLGDTIDQMKTEIAAGPTDLPGERLSDDAGTKEEIIRLGDISATTDNILIESPSANATVKRVSIIGSSNVAADDANYFAWSLQNRGAAGTGTMDVLDTGDVNTTKATGGSAVTAYVARSLALNATLGNRNTNGNDGLKLKITKTGSPTTMSNVTVKVEWSFQG